MNRSRSKGFTIVELLVVITIIGMLVAMLMPAIGNVRRQVQRTVCLNNQNQLGKAALASATRNGDMPNSMEWWLGADRSTLNQQWHGWVPPLLKDMGRGDVYEQIQNAIQTGQNPRSIQIYIEFLVCPSDPPASLSGAPLSYVVNGGSPDNYTKVTDPPDWRANGAWSNSVSASGQPALKVTLNYIQQHDGTSTTIMLGENVNAEEWNQGTINEEHTSLLWTKTMASITDFTEELSEPITVARARPSSRHEGGFVLTFCDSSGRFVSDQIDKEVYARLMSSAGSQTGTPNMASTVGSADYAFQKVLVSPADLDP